MNTYIGELDVPDFTDKSVIITGGAGDIARELAARLLAAGARVLLVDLDETRLQGVVEMLGSDSTSDAVSYCVADVTSEADTQRYVAASVERYGGVDVLFANAGIEGTVTPVTEYELPIFEKVLSVNVVGPFLGIKHVFPVMAEGGGGSIIITSSVAGVGGSPGLSAYITSKHAVIGLMRSSAAEGAAHNIRVNTVNPAPVEGRMISSLETGMAGEDTSGVRESMEARIPMQRYAVPGDVANLMLFLASDESAYLTGGVYMVDGGMTLS
jgi:NAD(P)-dependent dehydrogenase (short-subunit alcohol dehydrogenase family)